MIPGGGSRSSTRSRRSTSTSKAPKATVRTMSDDRSVDIIRRALEEPLRQIAENAGYEGSVEVQRVK